MQPDPTTQQFQNYSELAGHRHFATASGYLPTCDDKSAHFEECHRKRRACNCLAALLHQEKQTTLLIEHFIAARRYTGTAGETGVNCNQRKACMCCPTTRISLIVRN
jgi:hypothetical protein